MITNFIKSTIKRVFRFFSSLKTAIPLLVITIAVTIGSSLFPGPDLFMTWWYLGLLGLNGVSLLFITILHIPMILERKGRKALVGVVVTHMGILILIIGAIYGGMNGFRYKVKAIEGEMTVVPGLPFVIHLDKLVIEEYSDDDFAGKTPKTSLKKRQDSYLTLIKNGEHWIDFVSRPGKPAKVDGINILPSVSDVGWYFELIVTDPRGKEKVIPVRPWAPPIIKLGETAVMAHSLVDTGVLTAEIFTLVDEQMNSLGMVTQQQALDLDGYSIALGQFKRYTGLSIYNRPHAPILVIGCLAMLFGLVWHFYFRHRDHGRKNRGKEQMGTGSGPV